MLRQGFAIKVASHLQLPDAGQMLPLEACQGCAANTVRHTQNFVAWQRAVH